MENIRGQIYNRERAKQIVNFNGLMYGTITPTDIDGMVDFHGKCFVFMELKYRDNPLPKGQRLALEREVSDHKMPSIAIIGTHDALPQVDIDAKNCLVREYFFNGKWRKPHEPYSVKRFIDRFVGKYAPECLHLNGDHHDH